MKKGSLVNPITASQPKLSNPIKREGCSKKPKGSNPYDMQRKKLRYNMFRRNV